MLPLPHIKSAREERVGRWDDVDPSLVRSAFRYWVVPALRFGYLGFRCAGSPLP